MKEYGGLSTEKVISTYVEMILVLDMIWRARNSDLHVCGDDPNIGLANIMFST